MSTNIIIDTYKKSRDKWKNIRDGIKRKDQQQIIPIVLLSIIIVLLVEMLSRHSIWGGLTFVFKNPVMLLFNIVIILFTLSFAFLFTKRRFVTFILVVIWMGLGIGNFVLLFFRTTPLTAMDFYLLDSAIEMIPIYMNVFQIILLILAIPVLIVLIIFFWRKSPKKKRRYKVALILMASCGVAMLALSGLALKVKALSTNFSNLPNAYSDYGFSYCFSNSIFDRGIKEPDDYSETEVKKVKQKIEGSVSKDPNIHPDDKGEVTDLPGNNVGDTPVDQIDKDKKPNIVIVQLESFFDVNQLLDLKFSENPVPNFTRLKKNYSSGFLEVPSIGAGTANTEFEILTGMNIEYFGAGEYPYKTILQTTTSESINFDLGELGYRSHAIHNNTGTFYDRMNVYQKLGFDSFSSIEYMSNVEFNPIGWAKDKVITEEIMKALEDGLGPDFVYAISVQAHGKYPDELVDPNQRISVASDPEKRSLLEQRAGDLDTFMIENWAYGASEAAPNDGQPQDEYNNMGATNSAGEGSPDHDAEDSNEILDKYRNRFEYFVNQVYETDEFIGELVDTLTDYEEPTVVIFFGDHLPPLSLVDEDLVSNNLFQTEYVMWSNFPMEQVRKDMTAYQLTAYLQSRLGYEAGVLTRYHQRCIDEPNYQEELRLLQYDMLYGDRNVFEGINPFIEKTIQMGINEILITDMEKKGEAFIISGQSFTPWSVVYVGNESKETIFLDENTLIVPYEDLSNQSFYVAQVTDTKVMLSRSKDWMMKQE